MAGQAAAGATLAGLHFQRVPDRLPSTSCSPLLHPLCIQDTLLLFVQVNMSSPIHLSAVVKSCCRAAPVAAVLVHQHWWRSPALLHLLTLGPAHSSLAAAALVSSASSDAAELLRMAGSASALLCELGCGAAVAVAPAADQPSTARQSRMHPAGLYPGRYAGRAVRGCHSRALYVQDTQAARVQAGLRVQGFGAHSEPGRKRV